MKNTIDIPSILDDDIHQIFKQNGILQDFNDNKLKCSICLSQVDWNNLGGIYSDNENIKIVCNEDDCLDKINNSK
jgi:hypothetical protein